MSISQKWSYLCFMHVAYSKNMILFTARGIKDDREI